MDHYPNWTGTITRYFALTKTRTVNTLHYFSHSPANLPSLGKRKKLRCYSGTMKIYTNTPIVLLYCFVVWSTESFENRETSVACLFRQGTRTKVKTPCVCGPFREVIGKWFPIWCESVNDPTCVFARIMNIIIAKLTLIFVVLSSNVDLPDWYNNLITPNFFDFKNLQNS